MTARIGSNTVSAWSRLFSCTLLSVGVFHIIGIICTARVSCESRDVLLVACVCMHALDQLLAPVLSSLSVRSYCRVTVIAALVVFGRLYFRRDFALIFGFPAFLSVTSSSGLLSAKRSLYPIFGDWHVAFPGSFRCRVIFLNFVTERLCNIALSEIFVFPLSSSKCRLVVGLVSTKEKRCQIIRIFPLCFTSACQVARSHQ